MSIKDPGFANMRGIAVGMSLAETIQKISTGEFVYDLNLTDKEISSIDISKSLSKKVLDIHTTSAPSSTAGSARSAKLIPSARRILWSTMYQTF